MRILGIDPGYATIGYGIIDYFRGRFSVVGFGAITTKAGLHFEIRLRDIYDDMNTVIKKYKPDVIHIHNLHGYYLNVKTLLKFLQKFGKPVACYAVGNNNGACVKPAV